MSNSLIETINILSSDCNSCDSLDCFEDCPFSDCLYPSSFKNAEIKSDCNVCVDDINELSDYCHNHFQVNNFFELTCDCPFRNENDNVIWCEGRATPPYLWEMEE